MNPILTIADIRKNYGPICALNSVGFSVPAGSVFGILGPNGSGKTTMLGIILDVLKADSGNYRWEQYDLPEEARKKIGSLLETPNFFHYLNAVDNLAIVSEIKQDGTRRIDEVLKKVKLYERRFSKFSTYSLGMKQRLAIASALLADPQILVLDEPTNGLDPEGIAEIRELIIRLNREGKTIIMASHLLDEVEKVCTDVAILKKGNLLSNGPVDLVLSDEEVVEVGCADMQTLETLIRGIEGAVIRKIEKLILLTLPAGMHAADFNRFCSTNHVYLSHLQTRKRSLESKFMELTQ